MLQDLYKYVESLTNDSKSEFTPIRTVVNAQKVYTDHYAMRLVLCGIPVNSHKSPAARKAPRWNTIKEEGWDECKRRTTDNIILLQVVTDGDSESNTLMKMIDKELISVKHSLFGKVKVCGRKGLNPEMKQLADEKDRFVDCESTEE